MAPLTELPSEQPDLGRLRSILVDESLVDLEALEANDWYAVFYGDCTLYPDAAARVVDAYRELGVDTLYRVNSGDLWGEHDESSFVAVRNNVNSLFADDVGLKHNFELKVRTLMDRSVRAIVLLDWDDYILFRGPRAFFESASGFSLDSSDRRVFQAGSSFEKARAIDYYGLDNLPDLMDEAARV